MFSIGSYTIGMGEEYVPLIPILVTMSLAMRMDAIVAMGLVWVPYGIGWACAGINPFGCDHRAEHCRHTDYLRMGLAPVHDGGIYRHRFPPHLPVRATRAERP